MKKGIRSMAAGLCAILLLAGCGGSEAETSAYSEYVTLGQYKGIEISAVPDATDEDVEAEIAFRFRDDVRDGDTVNISYEGIIDGLAFEGGSAEGQYLTIGSGSYIDGFEEGLIGANIGDTVKLELSFPEEYKNNPDLSGEPVVFHVTINAIDGVAGGELTEEYVTANTKYSTIEEYKAGLKEEVQLEKDNEKLTEIWAKVEENATIKSYPQKEIDRYISTMQLYYEQVAESYGMDLASMLTAMNSSEEELDAWCLEYAQSECRRYMILSEIASAENITISEEEFEAKVQEVMEENKMAREDVIEYYGGQESMVKSLVYIKVMDFLIDSAVQL